MAFWPSTMVRWDPWFELRRFERNAQAWPTVRADVKEDVIKVRALVPGFAIEDLEVAVHGDTLRLRGKRKDEAAGEVSEFEREFELPFAVEAGKVKAVAKDGVLEIELPRAAADSPQRIAVQAG